MKEKYCVSRTTLLNGTQFFTLIFHGKENGNYISSFVFKTSTYKFLSDKFTGDSVYNAMVRAMTEGKKILRKEHARTEMADQAFAGFMEKTQLKFDF